MTIDVLNSKLKYHFVDEDFTSSNSLHYSLLLELSEKHLSIAAYSKQENKIIYLEHYTFGSTFTPNILADKLSAFFAQHSFIKLKFKKVTLAYVTPKFTLVPINIFDVNKQKEYFEFNNINDASLEIKHSEIKSVGAIVIFAIPQSILNAVKQIFPNVKIVSSFSPFIELCFKKRDTQYNNEMFLQINNDKLFACLFKGGKFYFANTYNYTNTDDAGYYINLILNQFQLNIDGCKINFSGIIEKNNTLFVELQKFLIKPNYLVSLAPVSYKLQEIPAHYFVQLFSLLLCE